MPAILQSKALIAQSARAAELCAELRKLQVGGATPSRGTMFKSKRFRNIFLIRFAGYFFIQVGLVILALVVEPVINEEMKRFVVGELTVNEFDIISLNGSTGEVYLGEVKTVDPELTGDFKTIMEWADAVRKLGVRTNADTPKDARKAKEFGAEGIGLCRTEHMFFEPERIIAVREMILADDTEGRQAALAKLLPMQKGDFKGIFKAMKGLPVTIRLLDPPLHEFLPHTDEELKALAHQIEVPVDKLKSRNKVLHEFNPMLGHRGCRLGITYPEIYAMQAQAIMEAACELAKQKIKVIPEIMIPLVGHVNELKMMRELVIKVAADVQKKYKIKA